MPQSSLLPFLHDAARHVEAIIGKPCDDLIKTVRAMASYDFAMLAYGYHPQLSMHSVAMTAAELLYIAEHLERAGGGPAQELDAAYPVGGAQALESDAGVLGTLITPLTQGDVARALAHFRHAVRQRDIDLVTSLALEMKNVRPRGAARASGAPGALH